jgi:hypothetical protein
MIPQINDGDEHVATPQRVTGRSRNAGKDAQSGVGNGRLGHVQCARRLLMLLILLFRGFLWAGTVLMGTTTPVRTAAASVSSVVVVIVIVIVVLSETRWRVQYK